MIFHVVSNEEWARLRARGHIDPAPAPFLHLCTESQLSGVVERYFGDADSVVALAVEEEGLGEALRWETGVDPVSGRQVAGGEAFPHLYGPLAIELAAVFVALPGGVLDKRVS
jgi:uncharacterized protein (DUF952 family)